MKRLIVDKIIVVVIAFHFIVGTVAVTMAVAHSKPFAPSDEKRYGASFRALYEFSDFCARLLGELLEGLLKPFHISLN